MILRTCYSTPWDRRIIIGGHTQGQEKNTSINNGVGGTQEKKKNSSTAVFWLVVQKLRRESTYAHHCQFKIPIKSARMRGFSSQFLDNQPENRCLNNGRHTRACSL